MKYSIIIPTYNHCDDLLKPCVESVLKHTRMADVELIISANGCVDNTAAYLQHMHDQFDQIGMGAHFKHVWSDTPLGYAGANNVAIQAATSDLIVLLNNDCVLLPQAHNFWLDALAKPFAQDDVTGISCVVKSWSDPAAHDFAIFFCVMIHRKVFDRIGLLNEAYGKGGGEDTEFSIECERAGFKVSECLPKTWTHSAHTYTGEFPIYHKGEGTVHDVTLVPDWDQVFTRNSQLLAEKYNPSWLHKHTHASPVAPATTCDHPDQVAAQVPWLANVNAESKFLFDEVIANNGYRIHHTHVRNRVVLDVGANMGMFSIMVALMGAKKVIACEPVTHTHDLLCENTRKAQVTHVVHAVKCAVTGLPKGPLHMGVQSDSGKSSLYDHAVHHELVPTQTLTQLLAQVPGEPVFLKLDCEGSEYDILLDTPPHVFDQVTTVAIEIHGDLHPVHKGCEVIQHRLAQLGFKLESRQPYGVWWFDASGAPVRWEPLNMTIELWSK